MQKIMRFLVLKTIRLATLLIAICFLSFWLVKHAPIDPVQAYIGADMMKVSPEQRAEIAAYWGLDQPFLVQFKQWLQAVVHGDFGTSMIYRQPVSDVLKERFLNSIMLMVVAWIFSGVFGFLLGVLAAMKEKTKLDRFIQWLSYTLASTPPFWIGLLFIMLFSVMLGWLPFGLGVPIGMLSADVTLSSRLQHLLLPAITLSLVGIPNVVLHTRQKMIDVLASEYIRFARARGESGIILFWRHGLKNVALPALTLQFASFSELFGGTILAEQVFSYPGLGQASVEAGLRGDIPLLLGIVICSTIFVFVGNTMADILYHTVNPLTKVGDKK